MLTQFDRVNLSSGNERTRGWRFAAVGALAFFSLIPAASASVVGTISESPCTGAFTLGVTVGPTYINWLPDTGSNTAGCIAVGSGTTMTYNAGTPLAIGTQGTLMDLSSLAPAPSINDFMMFTIGGTTLDFVLTGLGPGSSNTICTGLAVGASCSANSVSPFILTNEGGTTTLVSLPASGTITNSGVTSNWAGAFSAVISDETAAQIQATIGSGGSITSTQGGNFTATIIPEPASMTLFGAGLIAIAMAARKRRKA